MTTIWHFLDLAQSLKKKKKKCMIVMMANGGTVISSTASKSIWIRSTRQLPRFLKTNILSYLYVPITDFTIYGNIIVDN